MIDTHCHLFSDYYDNLDEVIEEFKNNGIEKVIVSGCDKKSNLEVLDLVSKYDCVYGTLGYHPTELDEFEEDDLDIIIDNINNKKIVGIGEIGLDYHYEDTDREKQIKVFKRQLDIAQKFNKPVVIHIRDAIGEAYSILEDYKLNGSIHCFSGSTEMAKKFISLGYMIGIGGIVTFKNARVIKEVVESISLAYILLETDSPYMAPDPYRGSKNSPKYIRNIAEQIALLKNVSSADVIRSTSENAGAVFDFYCE